MFAALREYGYALPKPSKVYLRSSNNRTVAQDMVHNRAHRRSRFNIKEKAVSYI